jgi:hypothetical protein
LTTVGKLLEHCVDQAKKTPETLDIYSQPA